MNYRIFTLLLSIFFLNTLVFAQSRPAKDEEKSTLIDPVSFEKPKFAYLTIGGKKWIKANIKARCKGDPDAKTANTDPAWLKNVEVNFTCAYSAPKNQVVWFSAPAKFYMLERNKDYMLTFYIPHEFVSLYSLKYDPSGYMIELKANGKDYPFNASNYKSRSNLNDKTVKSFVDNAASNASANQGVMTYFDDAPFIVQYEDLPTGSALPTSMPKR